MTDNMPEAPKPLARRGNPNWIKGAASPNPTGRADKPIAVLARSHAPKALKTLVSICNDKKGQPSARVSAAQAILDRAYGKAPSFSTSDATNFKRAVDMTDDELAAIASGAVLTLVPKK